MKKRVTSLTLEHVEARVAPRKVVLSTIARASLPLVAIFWSFLYAMAQMPTVVALLLIPLGFAAALVSMASIYSGTQMLDTRSANRVMAATAGVVLVAGSFGFYVFATSAVSA